MYSGTTQLTDYPIDPFGFVLPMNTHKVYRDSSQHDDHSQATNHWFRVQTEAQQHSPEYQVGDGDQHANLHNTKTHKLLHYFHLKQAYYIILYSSTWFG